MKEISEILTILAVICRFEFIGLVYHGSARICCGHRDCVKLSLRVTSAYYVIFQCIKTLVSRCINKEM